MRSSNHILEKFQVAVNHDWAFTDSRSYSNVSHGYHRYPAKFIPQIVGKLIETYTEEGDLVADVFAGCGTTLVESKLHGRRSKGVDINPVAQMITNAKISPIRPALLEPVVATLYATFDQYNPEEFLDLQTHEKLDYWFYPENKAKLTFLHRQISTVEDETIQQFLLCGLSNILKNCSRWLQSSTKAQRDPDKVPAEPFAAFKLQINRMVKQNAEFYHRLSESNNLRTRCDIRHADARRTRIRRGTVNAIITSPPYVTSYEYADIHQLSGYWFEYINDIQSFRKDFIGTFYSNNKNFETSAPIAQDIVDRMSKIDRKKAGEIANYFNDMDSVAREMSRILDDNGVACIVVGNTTVKDVEIKSAEGLAQLLTGHGFEIHEVIRREIPAKQIPTIRDINTGRFTKITSTNKKFVYPDEFIIIAKKNANPQEG